jgi:hypothetical protein
MVPMLTHKTDRSSMRQADLYWLSSANPINFPFLRANPFSELLGDVVHLLQNRVASLDVSA